MTQIIQYITVCITLFLSLIFGTAPDNLTATVTEPITTETQIISVYVENKTRTRVSYSGSGIVTEIEKSDDGNWTTFVRSNGGPEDSISLLPTVKKDIKVYLNQFGIETLPIGEYRLVLDYTAEGHRTAYAYFTVTE